MDSGNKEQVSTLPSLLAAVAVIVALERLWLGLEFSPSVAQGLAIGHGLGLQSFLSGTPAEHSLTRRLLTWLVAYPAIAVLASCALDSVWP